MQHTSNGLRIALLAGVSVVALAATAPSAGAADMNKPMPMKAAPAIPAPKDTWTWWFEGGAFHTDGGSVGFPAFKPNWGGEGAVGFDWQPFAPMHVVGQFRYGAASRNTVSQLVIPSGPTTINVRDSQNLREDHWLVDFGIGRDFGLGNTHAMWTLGIRVADLRSKLNINATAVSLKGAAVVGSTTIAAQEKTSFVGAGPRLGVQGDVPLGGQWSIDWQAGAAVLFGERTLTITTNTPFAGSQTSTPGIFNVDAQAGLSYWFSPNMKFTVGYRFDDYFKALRTVTVTNPTVPTVAVTSIDRAYSGPMARVTFKY